MDNGTAPRQKIENIQALRGFGVLIVVLYHLMLHERKYGGAGWILPDFFEVGASGVDLFFVISGFVIIASTRGRFSTPMASAGFIWDRITRIYPLYWLYSLLFVLAFYLFPAALSTASLSKTDIIKSFLLLPQDKLPVLAVGWTLVHEMYFYLVFALFLIFPARNLLKFLLIFFFFVISGNFAYEYGFFHTPASKLITHPLTVEFIAGCLVAELIYGGKTRYGFEALLAGTAGLIFVTVNFFIFSSWHFPDGWTRIIVFGAPYALIVYGAVAIEARDGKKISKIFGAVGDASYSIYLSHTPVLSVVGLACAKMPVLIENNLPLLLLMLAAVTVFGFLNYNIIERPLISVTRKTKKFLFAADTAGR